MVWISPFMVTVPVPGLKEPLLVKLPEMRKSAGRIVLVPLIVKLLNSAMFDEVKGIV